MHNNVKILLSFIFFYLFNTAIHANASEDKSSLKNKVAFGFGHTLIFTSTGKIWGWGYNSNGQLGDGTAYNKVYPVLIEHEAFINIKEIYAGGRHSIALKNDGYILAWGNNDKGQLGNNSTIREIQPVCISGISNVKQIACGENHTAALKGDGTVWAWGDNQYGQLGNNSFNNSKLPVKVYNISDVISIACGYNHTIALKNNGTVWTWGRNNKGQLGNKNTSNKTYPIEILDIIDIEKIAGGEAHTMALKKDGTVFTWGSNFFGQLGIVSTLEKHNPEKIPDFGNIINLAAGQFHSMAINKNGQIYFWGNNIFGQIGNPSDSKLTPLLINNPSDIVSINSNGNRSIAIDKKGKIYVWGDDIYIKQSGNCQESTPCIINEVNIFDYSVSEIPDQRIFKNTPSIKIPFTISPFSESYNISSILTNYTIIENTNIICRSNGECNIEIFPVNEISGTCEISINVSNNDYTVSEKFILTIFENNDRPVAIEKEFTTQEDNSLLLNDIWYDEKFRKIEYKIIKDTLHGTLSIKDELITYIPDKDFDKIDYFSFQIFDGQLNSEPANITIIVNPVNDPPISFDDSIDIIEDHNKAFKCKWSDIDNNQISISITENPLNGTVSIENDTIIYNPDKNFNGDDNFSYKVYDGNLYSISSKITLNVIPVNDRPIFASNYSNIQCIEDEGEKTVKWAENIKSGPEDESNQRLEFIVQIINTNNNKLLKYTPKIDITEDTYGNLSGNLIFEPASDEFGSSTFKAVLKDNGGVENNGEDSYGQNFTIEVESVNDCPVFKIKDEYKIIVVDNKNDTNGNNPQQLNIIESMLPGPSNEYKQNLEFKTTTNDNVMFEILPQISNDGILTFTPSTEITGTVNLIIRLIDDGGNNYGACDVSEPQSITIKINQKKYKLQVKLEDQDKNGRVQINDKVFKTMPCEFIVNAGENIQIFVEPLSNNNSFNCWKESLTELSSNNPMTFLMNQNKILSVNFSNKEFNLSINGKGSIYLNNQIIQLPFNKNFLYNSPVLLAAYDQFHYWTGDIISDDKIIQITLDHNTSITAHFKDTYLWRSNISLIDNEENNKNIQIGVSHNSFQKNIIEQNLSCNNLYSNNNQRLLQKDIRLNGNYEYIWQINYESCSEKALIKWNKDELCQKGLYFFETYDGKNQKIEINMREFNSYAFNNNIHKNFSIKWLISSDLIIDKPGWHLISLPILCENLSMSNLFIGNSKVYEYVNNNFQLLSPDSEIKPGKAYWLNIDNAQTLNIEGIPFPDFKKIELNQGWNYIGALDSLTFVEPETKDTLEIIYEFNEGQYNKTTKLKAGKGYIIKMKKHGNIILRKK